MLNSLDIAARPADTRVVVAMSGGVDSSVAAALLKAEGYDVVGVTLQLYDHGAATHRKGACCAGQDIHDARQVAERIGIPHYVLNYENRFKEAVIDSFARSYLAGETPVPCVDAIRRSSSAICCIPRAILAPACWRPATTLPRVRFRMAGAGSIAPATKTATRVISCSAPPANNSIFCAFHSASAASRKCATWRGSMALDVADKHDSQDICFVPSGRYTDIIERLMPGASEPGDIVDLSGKVLGPHAGIIHFTVGQRRGLGIAGTEPMYVVRLDAATRHVVVGPRSALRTARLRLRDVNWIGDGSLEQALTPGRREIFVKVRSTRQPQPAWLTVARRKSNSSTRGRVAPGQGVRILRCGKWSVAGFGWRLYCQRAIQAGIRESRTYPRDSNGASLRTRR